MFVPEPHRSSFTFVLLLLIVTMAGKGCEPDQSSPVLVTPDQSSPAFADSSLAKIVLPDGFRIALYARGIPNARSLVYGPDGTLYVSTRNRGSVYAVRDLNGDGFAETVDTLASGLNMPNGIALRDGDLFVAEVDKVWRYDDVASRLTATGGDASRGPEPVLISDAFPSDRHHGWKFIAFGPDGKLYVPVGAPCNICDPDEPYASIMRMNPDGSGLETYARGVRNSVGFTWDPETGDMWFTDNGRDMMGDDIPNCELNHAPAAGMHFGYPYFHEGTIPDPEFGGNKSAADYVEPAGKLGPHVAPLGLEFYSGDNFPREYQNRLLIAQHGSWNRSEKIGYRVMQAEVSGGSMTAYEPFATGWLQGETVWGRPVDVEVLPDGSVLISDDWGGRIYRVWYEA